MMSVGFKACPADASSEIKKISDLVSTRIGGSGAVREVIEFILSQQKIWDIIVNDFHYLKQ